MNTYLSLDLDFFDRTDVVGNTTLLRELLARTKHLPCTVVTSHEGLVAHIKSLKQIKFNHLINLDEHSDLTGFRVTRASNGRFCAPDMDCGNWVDHVPFSTVKNSLYTWYIPPQSTGTDCAEEVYGLSNPVRWRWHKRKHLKWGKDYAHPRHELPWRDIKACGIAMSPDYTCITAYNQLKRVVLEYHKLPSDCSEMERVYGIKEH